MSTSSISGVRSGAPPFTLPTASILILAAMGFAVATALGPTVFAVTVMAVIGLVCSYWAAMSPSGWVFFLLVAKPIIDLTWRWRIVSVLRQEVNLQSVVGVFVITFTILAVILRWRQLRVPRLVWAFLGFASLSVALSPSAQAANEIIRLFAGVSFFFVATFAIRTEDQFEHFAYVFLATVSIPVVLSLAQVAGLLPFEFWDYTEGGRNATGRASGTYPHPLGLIYFLIYAIPLALYLVQKHRSSPHRAFPPAVFIVLATTALVFTYHRTALVTILMVYLLWLVLSGHYRLAGMMVFLSGVGAFVLADSIAFLYQSVSDILQGRVEFSSGDFLRGRGMQWYLFLYSLWSGGPSAWVFGNGGSSAEGFVPFFGYWASDEPHNDFIRILHAYGAVGLSLYVSILISFFIRAFQLRQQQSMFHQQLGTIMIVVLFSIVMLSITTEPMRFPTGVWYLFALGAIVHFQHRQIGSLSPGGNPTPASGS